MLYFFVYKTDRFMKEKYQLLAPRLIILFYFFIIIIIYKEKIFNYNLQTNAKTENKSLSKDRINIIIVGNDWLKNKVWRLLNDVNIC